uniref:Ig-like domain-containing protein n=1 Tax=Denticeps clupeoides TaxID=299321 RepID=A0AAY4DE81_9TELE
DRRCSLVCLQVEGPSGPLQVQLGDSVLLPCSVRTPVPLEELEVEWRRSDSETLVLLFQDGEERGEEPEFRNRAHFFTEEISRGNFSLFLTDVRTEDEGDFMCEVHTSLLSASTTVLLQDLGTALIFCLGLEMDTDSYFFSLPFLNHICYIRIIPLSGLVLNIYFYHKM